MRLRHGVVLTIGLVLSTACSGSGVGEGGPSSTTTGPATPSNTTSITSTATSSTAVTTTVTTIAVTTTAVTTMTLRVTPPLDSTVTSFQLRRPTPAAFDFVDAAVPGSFAHVRIVVDLDRDGWDDIVLPAIFWDYRSGEPNPVAIWRGVGPGLWREDTEAFFAGAVPALIYPRKGLVADFNGDGWPDVYVADTGLDQAPFPGALDLLLLSDGSGRLRATEIPAESVGFHHGATAGDVDGDGDADLVVTDQAPRTYYLLSNDGTGHFERHDDWIPTDLQRRSVFTTELVDFDGDGNLDLFQGGHEWDGAPTVILWGDGSGDYSLAGRAVVPPVAGFGTVVDVAAGDLDGDGRTDLVVDRTGSWPPPRFYDGYLLQVLLQTDVRRFTDVTAESFGGDLPVAGADWLEWVFALDADGDGDLDLVIDPPQRDLTWWNDGTGRFDLGR